MEAVLFLVDKISLFLWVLLCGRKYLNASSQKRMQFLFLFPPLPQHPFDSPYFRSLARWIADDCVFARPLDSPNFRSALGGSPMMTYLLGRSTIQRDPERDCWQSSYASSCFSRTLFNVFRNSKCIGIHTSWKYWTIAMRGETNTLPTNNSAMCPGNTYAKFPDLISIFGKLNLFPWTWKLDIIQNNN